jgi:pimeloyl-ACP methyl ester carboxylesterase
MSRVGELIEVDGERVHVVETGRKDGPPLLLSTGLGGAWFDWERVVDLLAGRHRVIVFDRPGLGASPVGHRPPNLRAEAGLLAALAEWAGAPVTVVAHSVAAFHAEALARTRPDLVAGLVLVDPSCERDQKPGVRLPAVLVPLARAAGTLAQITGLSRLLGPWAYRRVLGGISRRGQVVPGSVVRSVYGRGQVLGTVLTEYVAYGEMAADLAALREHRRLPAVPLVVLTALGDLPAQEEARRWSACHARLAAMSPYGRQVRLPQCPHMVQLDRPDAVADAVGQAEAQRTQGAV